MFLTKFFNNKTRDLSNISNIERNTKQQRKECPNMSILETPKTPGEESDERRQSQVGRLCKNFVKLIEKFRQGSERYPQVNIFQK